MLRTMLKSKIHRATVTDANLHYVGSVTVDPDLHGRGGPAARRAGRDRRRHQRRPPRDLRHRGRRGIRRHRDQRRRRAPGPPRRPRHPHRLRQMDDAEAREFGPRVVFVDDANRVLDESTDPARVPEDAPASSLLVPGTRAQAALN